VKGNTKEKFWDQDDRKNMHDLLISSGSDAPEIDGLEGWRVEGRRVLS
jgi:hypothetical protein